MDKALKTIPGVGEVGIDTEASAGNGCYYVKMYDGSYDVVGFDSVEEAFTELESAAGLRDDEPDFPLSLEYDEGDFDYYGA
jgi:hypothetical protein